ncbi:arylamine N-acetyltransferase [Nocardioides sp. LS1]|uniref:arylamine N-acetyltransferase family protein n=1 Tax=Nocardioides sp. LS1 TaxID=1027620 RepID=UPI000F627759|nr:arylamine N-acetyltransferase [Nocardioides sp. LS1]GCD91746.1 arylamine N-acetyltransferase [Nocardioides sp. LS1]
MTGTAAYLHRIGDRALPPTLESLRLIHRHHLGHVPYENLAIMLGQPPSVDPQACLERVVEHGRAGYCFHQNGALEVVLRDLGYAVERRHGHVWTDESQRFAGTLNHLVLLVTGLPTDDNPDGRWWVDVGLGDAFLEPLPVIEGEHVQSGFRYTVGDVTPDGWSFRHDSAGSFTGIEVSTLSTEPAAVLASHAELSSPPDGHFAQLLVVQRRDATGVDVVRGCVRSRVEATGTTQTTLETYDAWRSALTDDLGLALDDVDEDDLRGLWERSLVSHRAWVEAGRP